MRRIATRAAAQGWLLFAVLVALGTIPTLASSAAAQAATTTAPAIDLVSISDSVAPGDVFTATFRILGPIDDVALQAAVHHPIATRDQLHLGLASGPTTDVASVIEPFELSTIATADGAYQFELDTSDPKYRFESGSVYPVQLGLRSGGAIVDSVVLYLVVRPGADQVAAGSSGFSVAMVVPFSAPPMLQPGGSTQLDAAHRRELESTVEALTATAGTPLTLKANPETLIGLLESGSARDSDLVRQMQLTLPRRETLLAPFVRIDPDDWMQSGHTSEFVEQVAVGSTAIEAALGVVPAAGTWLASDGLAAVTLTQLAALGLADRVIVPSGRVVALQGGPLPVSDGQRFHVVDGNGLTHDAIVADSAIQTHFDRSGNAALDAHHLLADLGFLAMAATEVDRGILVDAPADWVIDRDLLVGVLRGIDAHPLLSPTTVSELFSLVSPLTLASDPAGPIVRRELIDSGAPVELPLDARRGQTQNALVSFGNLVPNSNATPLLQRLLLVSASADLSEAQQLSYLEAVTARIEQEQGAVSAINADRITLSARAGEVPISLRNEGSNAVEVLVTFVSDKLEFPEGALITLVLQPGVSDIALPVEARASGDATLDVIVTSPDRGIELNRSRVIVRSTALSGVGLVIAAVALAFLLIWWLRNLRSGQRDERLLPA